MITGISYRFFAVFLTFFLFEKAIAQGVAVNESGAAANPSAILDIGSTQKGLLIPRMSKTDRDNIAAPAKALLIYNITSARFEVNTGTAEQPLWEGIVTLESSSIQNGFWKVGGNIGTQGINVSGTQNNKSYGLITNNILRLYVDSVSGRIGINTPQPKASLHISGTDALVLPSGTTAQRPLAPVVGMIRFNNETGKLEGYTTEGWKPLQ
jgi:hypothetical protein